MARPSSYCTVPDLMIGDIPTSSALDPAKYVADAADEIDSKIGFVYAVPVNTSLTAAPVTLLLKRLNAHLATGRLILAATILSEDKQLNAYGQSLVNEVEATLTLIATGRMKLDGAVDSGLTSGPAPHIPLISVTDPESNVEAFYTRIANPGYRIW